MIFIEKGLGESSCDHQPELYSNFFSSRVSFGFSKSVLIDNRVEAAATFDPIDRIPRQTHR